MFKKILVAATLFGACTAAMAGPGYHRSWGYHGGWWAAPLVVGGVIGYELSHPTVIVNPNPVLVTPAPVVQQAAYYCPTTQAYYPAVQTCDQPWLKVVP